MEKKRRELLYLEIGGVNSTLLWDVGGLEEEEDKIGLIGQSVSVG